VNARCFGGGGCSEAGGQGLNRGDLSSREGMHGIFLKIRISDISILAGTAIVVSVELRCRSLRNKYIAGLWLLLQGRRDCRELVHAAPAVSSLRWR